jgi:succinate-semialdehyde dehydrogenase
VMNCRAASSSAFIVLVDAELDAAVRSAVTGRFQNTGQVCLAAQRIIVEQPIAWRPCGR